MVATTNLPGSSHFHYFIGTKKQCEKWLKERQEICKRLNEGLWFNAYSPARIVSNREAARWRYQDGSRVIKFDPWD